MFMFSVHNGDVNRTPAKFDDQRTAIEYACKLVQQMAPLSAVAVADVHDRVIGVAIDDFNGVRFRYLAGFEPSVPAFKHGKAGREVGTVEFGSEEHNKRVKGARQ